MTRRLRPLIVAACGAAITVPLLASGASAVTHKSTPVASYRLATSVPPLVDDSTEPWSTWCYSVFCANAVPYAYDGFVYLPLAYDDWPSLTKYTGVLATSWSLSGNTFTVNLVPNATWQNGDPLTGTDVVDTVLLDGANGAAVWNDITDITAPSTHVVQLTLKPGVPLTTFEGDFLNSITPIPASVYGKFVTSSLLTEDQTYWKLEDTDPAAAATSSASKALTTLLSKLEAFDPGSLIGDGPYKLLSATASANEFVKWNGFYDAKMITVPEIIGEGTVQNGINANLLTGHATFAAGYLYMPPAILDEWSRTPNANLEVVKGIFEILIIWKDNLYPFTITKVRQALAYAFPVSSMIGYTYGSSDGHASVPIPPDGLVSGIADEYLRPSQVASFDSYSYNTSKAATLLEQAGFHRNSAGDWIMPNGKPFKLTLTITSVATDQVAALNVAASALTAFGIPSTEQENELTTYEADTHNGDFDVTTYCCTGASPDPLEDFVESPMGSAENFTSPGEPGISYGPVETVPGIGKVNIPDTLNKEYATTGPGAKMDALTYDWASFVENQVPFLEWAGVNNQIAWNSTYYDWPAKSNPLWTEEANNAMELVLAQMYGLLHPK